MAMIVNTVETIGDAALTASIIDGSITELRDDRIVEVLDYALSYCALNKVVLAAATSIGTCAFYYSSSLEFADLHCPTKIGQEAFRGCAALATLIIRNSTVPTYYTNCLKSTAIDSGTGYIYVPSSLVNAYKAANGWKNYTNQIRAIEDYPEICDPDS